MKYPLTYRFAYPLIFAWCLLRAIYLQSLSLPSGKTVSLMVHTTAQVVVVVVVRKYMLRCGEEKTKGVEGT